MSEGGVWVWVGKDLSYIQINTEQLNVIVFLFSCAMSLLSTTIHND